MKKWICLLLCLSLTMGVILGCDKDSSANHTTSGSTTTTTTTTTTESTTTAPAPFDLEALQTQIPEEQIDTMKLDFIRCENPDSYPSYDEEKIEKEKRSIKLTFYAVFDDMYVVLIQNTYTSEKYHVYERVEDVLLAHCKGAYLRLYCDGQYYTLQEAYDAQLIDCSKLETVAENYHTAHPEWIPDLTPGEYSDTLSDELRAELLARYSTDVTEETPFTVAGFVYYGTYNGYAVLMSHNALSVVGKLEIAGRVFEWGSWFYIYAYKDGLMVELREVYASGGIPEADLDTILYQHKKYEYDDSFYCRYGKAVRWCDNWEEVLQTPEQLCGYHLGVIDGFRVIAIFTPSDSDTEGMLEAAGCTFTHPGEFEIYVLTAKDGLVGLGTGYPKYGNIPEEVVQKIYQQWVQLGA